MLNLNLSGETQRVVRRGLRGFAAGAVASMLAIGVPTLADDWSKVWAWISVLTMSGLVGGVSGLLLAADKFLRDARKK